jgi:hypothetical protein
MQNIALQVTLNGIPQAVTNLRELEAAILEAKTVLSSTTVIGSDEFKKLSSEIGKKAFLKNDVSNNFIPIPEPTVGFSDDDIRNVETMKKHFENEPDNILQTYLTAGGIKRKY